MGTNKPSLGHNPTLGSHGGSHRPSSASFTFRSKDAGQGKMQLQAKKSLFLLQEAWQAMEPVVVAQLALLKRSQLADVEVKALQTGLARFQLSFRCKSAIVAAPDGWPRSFYLSLCLPLILLILTDNYAICMCVLCAHVRRLREFLNDLVTVSLNCR